MNAQEKSLFGFEKANDCGESIKNCRGEASVGNI
jgi:hypothetical protein